MATEALFHIATRADWEAAQGDGDYRISTLGRTLDEVGFIHMSFGWQVKGVADFIYRGRDDLVLLRIDPARLPGEVVVEAIDAGAVRFPHHYGPLPVDAVTEARPLPMRADGTFDDVE